VLKLRDFLKTFQGEIQFKTHPLLMTMFWIIGDVYYFVLVFAELPILGGYSSDSFSLVCGWV